MTARILLAAALVALPATTLAQTQAARDAITPRSEIMTHFDGSMSKVVALAKAMPAEAYRWKPEPAAMEVGQVFAHIANYNFGYLTGNMGVTAPAGIKRDTVEAMRDKAQIVALLERSMQYVKQNVAAMPAEQLDRQTNLYGRTVPQWAVLMQLVAHMNEHLGQSIAYARANKIVPPWSS
jgi:uncharacterized damage-inducible protein DinB